MKVGIYLFVSFINYLLGSIPFAYFITKGVIKKDIREIGSGNVGATNVYRSCGPIWGVLVFILDMLKGYISVLITRIMITKEFNIVLSDITVSYEIVILTSLFFALLGHMYSIFLGFYGGKGVAIATGIFIALTPKPMQITLVIWFLVTAISRYVSLGSIVGAIAFPILVYWFNCSKVLIIFSAMVSLFIFIKHLPNIKRIINGEELRIGERV